MNQLFVVLEEFCHAAIELQLRDAHEFGESFCFEFVPENSINEFEQSLRKANVFIHTNKSVKMFFICGTTGLKTTHLSEDLVDFVNFLAECDSQGAKIYYDLHRTEYNSVMFTFRY